MEERQKKMKASTLAKMDRIVAMRREGYPIHAIASSLGMCSKIAGRILKMAGEQGALPSGRAAEKISRDKARKIRETGKLKSAFDEDPRFPFSSETGMIYLVGFSDIPDQWKDNPRAKMGMT